MTNETERISEERKKRDVQERESRFRCPICGGPTSVDQNYCKAPHMMIRYRMCKNEECQAHGPTEERLSGEWKRKNS